MIINAHVDDAGTRMVMMPYCRLWSWLQLTGQADFWHPVGLDYTFTAVTCVFS